MNKYMKKKIIVSAPMDFVKIESTIPDNYELIFNTIENISAINKIEDKDMVAAWIVSPCPKYQVSAEVLDNFKNIKCVVTPSTGVDHINVLDIESQGIKVLSLRHSPKYFSISASSEYTFSLMLSLLRNIPKAVSYPINGKWRESEKDLRAKEVMGLKIGIIGFGRIGQNVGRYSTAMGAIVKYYDPYVTHEDYERVGELKDLFTNSDMILVCPVLTTETKNLINKDILKYSKNDQLIVNTSRGEVVNENDIVSAVNSGIIYGYACDVLCGEISGEWTKSPILELVRSGKNVLVSPHIAGLTYDSESKAQNISINLAVENSI